jgi:hypothetical protein
MDIKNVRVDFGDAELMAKHAKLELSVEKAARAIIGNAAFSMAKSGSALLSFRGSVQARYTGRRSYLDCYILRLTPKTVYSYGGLFSMKKFIEKIYPEYSYESVIKQCLLLRKWSRIYWQRGLWEAQSNMIDQCIVEKHQLDFSTFAKRMNRAARKARILGAIRQLW